jgi:hypothetical protein
MKQTRIRFYGLLLFALSLAYAVTVNGATAYNQFVPANGILKGSTATPVTTAAAWSDVQLLLSGTCNSSVFVRGDGTCVAVPVTGAALTKTDDTNVTLTLGGSPTTALVNASSLTLGWTGTLAAARGGLGMSTVTDDTVAVANGTTWQSKALTDCDGATNAVTYDTTGNAWGCNTIAGVTYANPTGTIGLSAVNGVATTAMRSDGAPALSQAISPTWTGSHVFTTTTNFSTGSTPQAYVVNSTASAGPYTTFARNGTAKADIGLGTNCGGSFTADALCITARTGFNVELAANGATSPSVKLTSSLLTTTVPVIGPAGSASAVAFGFTGTNGGRNGGYYIGTDNWGLAGGGALALELDGGSSLGLHSRTLHAFQDGDASIPGITFNSDINTGVYRVGADSIGLSTGGSNRVTVGPGVQVGSPTGGDKGAGTINATGLYINNVAVSTGAGTRAYAFISVSGGSCTVAGTYSSANVSSCTYNSTGNYTLNFSITFPSKPICTTTLGAGGAYILQVSSATTTSATITIVNSSGGAAIDDAFQAQCVG